MLCNLGERPPPFVWERPPIESQCVWPMCNIDNVNTHSIHFNTKFTVLDMEKLVICTNQVHPIQRHNKNKYYELKALWILSVQRKVSTEMPIQRIGQGFR